MLRSSLIAASAVLLCGAATAQESSPLNWSVHQGKPKFGGTYHLMTGKWTRQPGQLLPDVSEGALTRVYDNTCLWTGAAPNTITFNGSEACEQIWDNGRIPGSGSGTAGATDDNLIEAVTFGHLTFAPVGTVDVTINFYDALGGNCAGFASPNPPAPVAQGSLLLNSANGTTLPGDPTGGGTAWFLTIDLAGGGEFCLLSEGDGTAGSGSDTFNWSYTHNNPTTVVAGAGGLIIAAEPFRGAFGACTYSIACGSDPIVGACGTGLNQFDGFWQNVDGDPAGPTGATNTSLICPSPPAGTGTGCFFFGGWPGNPWSGYFMALDSAGPCATIPAPVFYCTGKTGSNGCVPFLVTDAGTASASATGPWNIRSNDMNDAEAGFMIYSFKKANLNFQGGKLCVKAPFTRTPIAKTKQVACIGGGCTTTSCRQLRRNFNAAVQGGGDPLLTAGQIVRAQMRQRDPTEPAGFGSNLSDGVSFTIAP